MVRVPDGTCLASDALFVETSGLTVVSERCVLFPCVVVGVVGVHLWVKCGILCTEVLASQCVVLLGLVMAVVSLFACFARAGFSSFDFTVRGFSSAV